MNIRMPDRVYARLASIADDRGVKIAELIADAAMSLMDESELDARVKVADVAIDPRLQTMVDAGLTINQIAVRLHTSVTTVRGALELAGLRTRGQAVRKTGRPYDEVTEKLQAAMRRGDKETIRVLLGIEEKEAA